MLIDGNDAPTLRNLLARHEDAWAEDEALHDALAAAWQALSRPQRALDRYYTPRLREHRGDFLWMLGYADALEQNGDTDRAWRLREALLQQARRERPADAEPTAAQLDQARRAARLRLARSQNPGDPSHAVLREILRLDRPADAPFSPAARELVLAWFIDQGQIEGVRGFLWHQYGKSLARPLWAETTAALGSADPREAGRLLEQWDERLPRYDRVNLARLAGTPAIAATAAFEAMDLQRDDETSHLQLTEIMLEQADRADLDLAQRQLGSIDESFTGARLDIGLAPGCASPSSSAACRARSSTATTSAPCPASRPSPWPASTGSTTTAPPASPSAGATATPATRRSSSSANSASTASSASPPPSAATSPPPRTPPCASPACASKRASASRCG
jgi:hypothetical protein